ncbi:MAG: coiled coil domain-containing protein [Proteobacteria bacterium]|nr:MAG: coiled coil domain-containing protein [Pseudomonadota bacterium]QKK12178.1 MAG: coiled coil domain-containing protein [Pseudomonadota bacterium]
MDKELYQRKMQAHLDEWKADVDKLRARVSRASADTQLKMNEQIKELDSKIAEGKVKVSELSGASEDAWESIREGVESAWDSLKSAVSEATAKFKD